MRREDSQNRMKTKSKIYQVPTWSRRSVLVKEVGTGIPCILVRVCFMALKNGRRNAKRHKKQRGRKR